MFCPVLETRLAGVRKAKRLRELGPIRGFDFTSNDTLGFARDPELQKRIQTAVESFYAGTILGELPVSGAGGSRVLRGNLPIYEELERHCAEFSGAAEALFFPSGYQANCGVLSGLLTENDTVYSDSLNHASLIDGIRISRAQKRVYRHGSVEDLRRILTADLEAAEPSEGSLRLIVTESVFSMDGDLAPLEALVELAEAFGAFVVVDEAHATGLWGRDGRGGGRVQALGLTDRVLATIHPAGKALGVSGAWVAGSAQVKAALVNFSRGFLFSTAPSPLLALSLLESLQYWKEVGPERAETLLKDVREFRRSLSDGSFEFALAREEAFVARASDPGECVSPIIPIVIGSEEAALRVAGRLQDAGLDVRAIRPPTVPIGTSRLRVMLHFGQSSESRGLLLKTLREIVGSLKPEQEK